MVGPDGVLPLPWLDAMLRETLQTRRAHALLLQGPRGVGQFELALSLAQAWLCEAESVPGQPQPCGHCASCRLVRARSHPDLLVLLPDALRETLGWDAADAEDAGSKPGKSAKTTKPSKEIKVEAVRGAVAFAQMTTARGRCKVVVVHPAERMNEVSANTLLKTLEEPPGKTRFVLACSEPDALLATIRSRCQVVPMRLPPSELALTWLAQHGIADPAVMLAAVGGQPQEALEWVTQCIDATLWTRLPGAVARGESALLAAWPLPRVVDALQKLCHDASCIAVNAPPRYFPLSTFASRAVPQALAEWSRELARVARHAEHPWNPSLLIEALVQQGQRALRGANDALSGRTGASRAFR